MTTTARLALPLIEPGQAQKEMTHNEALATIDAALHAGVVDIGGDAPPAAPAAGQCWIVGAAPTGVWAGHPLALASWTAGGWRFVRPVEGMAVWSVADGVVARFVGGRWEKGVVRAGVLRVAGEQVVGARQAAIPAPTGGSVADLEARATIGNILTALRSHGLIAAS
jgi:hypothetical protein